MVEKYSGIAEYFFVHELCAAVDSDELCLQMGMWCNDHEARGAVAEGVLKLRALLV